MHQAWKQNGHMASFCPPGTNHWGWANVSYHHEVETQEVQTPNLDDLVKDGLESAQIFLLGCLTRR